jgi:hypothetical protein
LPSGAAGVDPTVEVDAMSELVAELSREVAAAVHALPDDASEASGTR